MKQSGIPEKLIFEQPHVYRRVCTAENIGYLYIEVVTSWKTVRTVKRDSLRW